MTLPMWKQINNTNEWMNEWIEMSSENNKHQNEFKAQWECVLFLSLLYMTTAQPLFVLYKYMYVHTVCGLSFILLETVKVCNKNKVKNCLRFHRIFNALSYAYVLFPFYSLSLASLWFKSKIKYFEKKADHWYSIY